MTWGIRIDFKGKDDAVRWFRAVRDGAFDDTLALYKADALDSRRNLASRRHVHSSSAAMASGQPPGESRSKVMNKRRRYQAKRRRAACRAHAELVHLNDSPAWHRLRRRAIAARTVLLRTRSILDIRG